MIEQNELISAIEGLYNEHWKLQAELEAAKATAVPMQDIFTEQYLYVLRRMAPTTQYMVYKSMKNIAEELKREEQPQSYIDAAETLRNICRKNLCDYDHESLFEGRDAKMNMVVLWEPKEECGWYKYCYDRAKEILEQECDNPGKWGEALQKFKEHKLTAVWCRVDYLAELPEEWLIQFGGWLEGKANEQI
ncbi:MAG: hypothetical protein LUD51_07075 [Clostridia bacterium]|nr:hypothetical protein [Clostridia bacterium]